MSERRGTKALELWCRRIAEGYKDVKITNMSTSWRDGLAFCAIIHNFRPDLIDFASLSKDNVYYNNELAFTIAEQHLGIPSLLDPADMVKYEVPDRFSILTYLSQYYRVFSNQASNKKVVAKDTKPDDLTSKIMANKPAFVGVPKRASCNRCSNPIFLAERISFGEKSYHRSCLKCARCGTQLTVGSFYETEVDGEYCCETCPDEEIQLEKQRRESSPSSEGSDGRPAIIAGTQPVTTVPTLPKTVRSSKLLDRISFFESAPLSDEEKTSNLERKTRMSNFLKETLKDVEQVQDEPPDLPATGPPVSLTSELDGKEMRDSADSDDVEDEFEKLVEGLDEEDLDSETNSAGVDSMPEHGGEKLGLPTELPVLVQKTEQNDAVLPNDVEATEVKVEKPLAMKSSMEKVDSFNDVEETEAQPVPQELEAVKQSSDSDETPIEVSNAVKELNVVEQKVPETVESSDVKSEDRHDVIDDKQAELKSPPPSNEISKDDATVEEISIEDVKVIVDSVTPESSVTVSEPPTQGSDVPEENECTELKLPSSEVTEPEESTRDTCTVPSEVVEKPIDDTKVPVSEESKIPSESPEVASKGVEHVPAETKPDEEQYPSDLNPFGDDEDGEGDEKIVELRKVPAGGKPVPTMRRVSTNPFGSDDEEDDGQQQSPSSKPPRPPPPKVKSVVAAPSSRPVPANPFDEDDDDGPTDEPEIVSVAKPSPRRTPVPTPRKAHAYNDSISSLDNSLMSSSRLSSSNVSLASSMESGPSSMIVPTRRKKGKAPEVPTAAVGASTPTVSQQQQATPASVDKTSIENLSIGSGSGTLTTPRKKRLAPAPPPVPSSTSTPKQSSLQPESSSLTRAPSQRLLSVDASLLSNSDREPFETMSRGNSNESVVYRRTIVPLVLDDDGPDSPVHDGSISGRQWEKMKDNKEAQNRNRQSQSSPTSEGHNSFSSPGAGFSILANKSSQGKWKRRKGPAPALPIIAAPLPERKPIKMLPLKEIHQELQIIETQQQGLEKQGIVLEKMIRERCEGFEADIDLDIRLQANSKEVEDLIMQLFELVNEKNELFRRQAELMYLRRMHRLEQEQADLEYEIRLLMAQPERNKTDSDKEKEEALIARLVEIVQQRNEVVERLEMDRIREAEEDLSIKQSIEERAASQQSKHGSSKKDSSQASSTTLPLTDAEKRDSSTKLSKKEKKKLKEAKKLVKSKKIDSEKDADETESSAVKEKKKKRKFLF
ncbi:MICAL-like protein 1 isoform X2 [Anopheles stephensi]|uniref:MICAL-like protein 1 isoform X2 n=1 Tax=Anopheles stephensi TaxID=30069 RepID=UPI00165879DE|nr:MICAL-like protein 1 isoform X2 [Anopheles stephensi]